MKKARDIRRRSTKQSAAQNLYEAEQLFLDFKELTPFRFQPLAKSFVSFRAYHRWRRAQKNPWYR